jgi:SAM-dependent methyltransferase
MKSFSKGLNLITGEKEFYEYFYQDKEHSRTVDPHALFESISAFENKFIIHFFGNLEGKVIADIGAGTGESSIYFALKGAKVIWIDIAQAAYEKAKYLVKKFNVEENIHFLLGDILEIFKNYHRSEIDLIYGNGVLHHIDYEKLPESMYNVLKNGGKFAFIEPLKYNPLINIYRILADKIRTPGERPLGFEINKKFKKYFYTRHREFWLFSLAVFLKFYLINKIHPNDEPYWKKIFYDVDKCKRILSFTGKLDSVLTGMIPLNYLCWNTVLYGIKS